MAIVGLSRSNSKSVKMTKYMIKAALSVVAITSQVALAQNFKVVYFDALSTEDVDRLQQVFYSLHEEYPRADFKVQNFYEAELEFSVRFGASAYSLLRPAPRYIDSERKKEKLAPKTKPLFKCVGLNPRELDARPKNVFRSAERGFFEESNAGRYDDIVILYDVNNSEAWDWTKRPDMPNQRQLELESWDFKPRKDWSGGVKGKYPLFYDGKPLLTKSFVKELRSTQMQVSQGLTKPTEIVIIYANDKVESEYSCESIARDLAVDPDAFEITHDYEYDYSKTLRPSNGAYSLYLNSGDSHDVFSGFQIKVEVASGSFSGKSFEVVEMELDVPNASGRITQSQDQYEVSLNVEWLGGECLRVSGEEYADPDCECREECLYQKDFFISIKGVGDSSCEGLDFPWSDKMKISFQCEK